MERLDPKDQKNLYDLVQLHDLLVEEINQEPDGFDPEKAKRLLAVYDAMSELLIKAKEKLK